MVRKAKSTDSLRVLDGQGGTPSSEGGEASSQGNAIEVDIGLDVSTSVIGVCVLNHHTGALIDLFPVKLQKASLEDIWDKALDFRLILGLKHKPEWVVKRVFVEDVAKVFSPGFSSAGTIVTLAKMNALACLIAMDEFKVKPSFVNVRSARSKLGIKIDTKDKTKNTKEKVFEIVLALNPKFPWIQHVAKTGKHAGNLVYDACNQDMGDAWVTCRGGQVLFP